MKDYYYKTGEQVKIGDVVNARWFVVRGVNGLLLEALSHPECVLRLSEYMKDAAEVVLSFRNFRREKLKKSRLDDRGYLIGYRLQDERQVIRGWLRKTITRLSLYF